MTDLLELTAARAIDAIRRGEVDPGELWSAYRERSKADPVNAYVWVAGEEPPEVDRGAPLAGVPVAIKDLFATEGVPSQAGSKILEGYRPPYTATVLRSTTPLTMIFTGARALPKVSRGSNGSSTRATEPTSSFPRMVVKVGISR